MPLLPLRGEHATMHVLSLAPHPEPAMPLISGCFQGLHRSKSRRAVESHGLAPKPVDSRHEKSVMTGSR
jgi:hypothetical protein